MKNEVLRHIISTIKYRFEKSIKGSQKSFGDFSLGKDSRSPREIVNHMFEVIYLTRVFIEEESLPNEEIDRLSFESEVERFIGELSKVDQLLENKSLELIYAKRLVQGPFSDVLTHIGQIAMLRRLVENPIDWEDFSRREIRTEIKD